MDYSSLQSLPPVLRDFLVYHQTVKGRSSGTVEQYYLDLRTFFRYLKFSWNLIPADTEFESISIDDIDIDFIKKATLSDIYGFMAFCQADRDNDAKTRARKTSALRSYFKYLHKKAGLIDYNPVEELDTPKSSKKLPKYLTLDESQDLLKSIDGPYKERDYAILTLFLNCGLRLSELCGLNLSDIRKDRTMRVFGKGNKERIIYLNDACLDAVDSYLKVRPKDGVKDKNALFLSRLRKRISNKTVQHIVYKYLSLAGLGDQGYSVHKLRHTAATLMYQYGKVDIRILKEILGHENLGTTEIYTHLSNSQMQNAAESNPLAKEKQK